MIEFIVIVESSADARTATKLGDRVLLEKVAWLEPELLEHLFRWTGLEENTDYSCWKDMGSIIETAKQKGLRLPRFIGRGRYGSPPLKADGASSIKVLNLVRFLQKTRPIKAVLLIRDLDNQPERREGIEQARSQQLNEPPKLQIIIGTADKTRESWVLNGFIPSNDRELQILEEIKAELNFDPCEESHRLRASEKSEPERIRNPKIVLEKLTGGDMDREKLCWEETSLDILRARGFKTGLTAYLIEIEERLAPILSE
jgi:hypothetical protein